MLHKLLGAMVEDLSASGVVLDLSNKQHLVLIKELMTSIIKNELKRRQECERERPALPSEAGNATTHDTHATRRIPASPARGRRKARVYVD